jgi:peptidoglycan/LPS O-acetylase OafA/YrhL
MHFMLPWVFTDNPIQSINGSLWTLPIEFSMYIISAALIALRIRSRTIFIAITALMLAAYSLGRTYFGLSWEHRGPDVLPSVPLFNFLGMGFFFFVGAAFSKFDHRPNGFIAFASAALLVGSAYVPMGWALYCLVLPYCLYYLAFAPYRIEVTPGVDISYGFYLYAFPIQQLMVHVFGRSIEPNILTLIAAPITAAVAFISWRLVEKPALSLKNRPWAGLSRARSPEASTELFDRT